MASGLVHEKIWMDKSKYDDAERQHYENLAKLPKATKGCTKETDSNSNLSSPETPILNSKKTKIPKYVLVARETDYASILELCEFKEKTSKRSKKSKEANRQRELMMNSISNKELPPSPAREEPLSVPNVVVNPVVNVEAPIKPQKNKETKEKLSKAEKKRANRKEKEENHKIEEKQPVVEVVEVVSQITHESDHCELDQGGSTQTIATSSLASEVAKARQHIKNSLECMDTVLASVPNVEVSSKLNYLETAIGDLRNLVLSVQSEVKTLAESVNSISMSTPPRIAICPMAPKVAAPVKVADPKEDSDDGVDLFASDSDGEDDAAAAKIREERLASYAAKKSKKPVLIAKSNIILDVKPWDDETDMKVMEEKVRAIATDGLLWGASKLVTLAYGIQKLQISCVVEDDKVSIDWLQEEIEKNEDYVQSVDIAAFNKV